MRRLAGLALLLLAGCIQPEPVAEPQDRRDPSAAAREAVERFVQVVTAVEPVAESLCRRRAPEQNCDYLILVNDRVEEPPNAFQALDRDGRPLIIFTVALLADVRNADELALVLGHEAAHHIAGHLTRRPDPAGNGMASRKVGARSYSKEYEIEADKLGALIAQRAGFNPIRGAEYFTRMPDPGHMFLGTHPPNAMRIKAIHDVVNGT